MSGKRAKRKIGRFSIDSLGNLTVLNDDLRTGIELDRDQTSALREFLCRVLRYEAVLRSGANE